MTNNERTSSCAAAVQASTLLRKKRKGQNTHELKLKLGPMSWQEEWSSNRMCYRLYIDIIDSYPTVVQNRQLSSQDATGRVHAVSWIRSCHASDLPSALPPHVTYFDIKNVAIIIQYMYDFVKCSPCWGTCSPSNRPGEAQTQHAHGNCLEPWPWKSDSAKRRIQIIYCRLSLILHVHFALLGAAHRQQPYIQSRHNIKTPIRLSMAQLGSWILQNKSRLYRSGFNHFDAAWWGNCWTSSSKDVFLAPKMCKAYQCQLPARTTSIPWAVSPNRFSFKGFQ